MAEIERQPRRITGWDELATRRPLPVQFALYASQRVSKALCPCLVVRVDGVEVIRILDPEHREPFFSLDGVFLLSGMTILEGILRFDLRRDRGDYDLTLAGLEPREGIWAPWGVAKSVIEDLRMYDLFRTMFSCQQAWSLDEGNDGITHNWRGDCDDSDPAAYSLASLLDTPLSSFAVLPRGQQLRTFVSSDQRLQIVDEARPLFLLLGRDVEQRQRTWRVEQRLLRWSVQSVERYTEAVEHRSVASEAAASSDQEVNVDGDGYHHGSIQGADLVLFLNDMIPSSTDGGTISIGDDIRIPVSDILASTVGAQAVTTSREACISLLLAQQFSRLYLDRAVSVARHRLTVGARQSVVHSMQQSGTSDQQIDHLLCSNQRIEASLDALLHIQQIKARSSNHTPTPTPSPSPLSRMSWQTCVNIAAGILISNIVLHAFFSYS